jgi:DNA-directed RNA polymerase beta' subunit
VLNKVGLIGKTPTDEEGRLLANYIEPGDEVETSMCTGDVVVLNRQPTLWRQSVLALRVTIGKDTDRTAYVHPAHLIAFAGDCDGDVISGHFMTTLTTQVSAMCTLGPQVHIASAQTGGAVFSFVQDHILAMYLLTAYRPRISVPDMVTLCSRFSRFSPPPRF